MARRHASPAPESQQMLALSHLIEKPKNEDMQIQEFRETIIADRNEYTELLSQRKLQAKKEQQRRREELTSTILKALQPSDSAVQSERATFAGTRISANTVYTSVASVLSASESLINEYHRLDGIIAKLRDEQPDSIADTWKQDVEDTDKQLSKGARVALRNVKKVLGADVEDSTMTDEDGDVDMERGEKVELNYELQKSLRYAERGVKRMVKGLPMSEGY